MNVLLQRHCARYIYVVPEGLRELMSDISREVIRSHPKNMYLFIADYLDALMITRENARVAARLVQSITEITTTTVEFLEETGMDRSEADHIVRIIQKAFKKLTSSQPSDSLEMQSEEVQEANIISDIINEANIGPEEGEEAAIIIQRAFRQFKLRKQKEKEMLSGMIDWRAAARSAIHLYRHTGVTVEEANRAATLIKAAYKGYYTRRLIKKLAEEGKLLDQACRSMEDEEEGDSSEKLSFKAVTINYETVIPHVDFDETKVLSESTVTDQASMTKTDTTSSGAVVMSTLESILEAAFQQSEAKELKFIHLEADVEEEHTGRERLSEIKEEQTEEKKVSLSETGEHTTEVSEATGIDESAAPSEEPEGEHEEESHNEEHTDTSAPQE